MNVTDLTDWMATIVHSTNRRLSKLSLKPKRYFETMLDGRRVDARDLDSNKPLLSIIQPMPYAPQIGLRT
jgi:hypothetical protein